MKEKFIEIFKQNIARPGSDKLLAWMETTDFFEAPASTRFHLSRPGGLVEHSVHVYDRLMKLYTDEKTDPYQPGKYFPIEEEMETIAICGLLHDICKVGVYATEPKNQKNYDPEYLKTVDRKKIKHDSIGDFAWETILKYKYDDKIPYGHGEKSVYIISGFMKLTREEAMAIRWHMGPWQDGEKQLAGNAFGRYPLSVLMHIADLQATYLDEADQDGKNG